MVEQHNVRAVIFNLNLANWVVAPMHLLDQFSHDSSRIQQKTNTPIRSIHLLGKQITHRDKFFHHAHPAGIHGSSYTLPTVPPRCRDKSFGIRDRNRHDRDHSRPHASAESLEPQ